MRLTDRQINYCFSLLCRKRERVRTRALRIREQSFSKTATELSGELSAYDNHPADLASEYFLREQDHLDLMRAGAELKRIERAIERIHAGRYGKCRDCGRPISFERLCVLPEAELCYECQRLREETERNRPGQR